MLCSMTCTFWLCFWLWIVRRFASQESIILASLAISLQSWAYAKKMMSWWFWSFATALVRQVRFTVLKLWFAHSVLHEGLAFEGLACHVSVSIWTALPSLDPQSLVNLFQSACRCSHCTFERSWRRASRRCAKEIQRVQKSPNESKVFRGHI